MIGIDEAGRGCLAGPVVAGAVLFPADFDVAAVLPGLNDSKKITAKHRAVLTPLIRKNCLWGVGFSWPAEIDHVNILQATFRAMSRAVAALERRWRHEKAGTFPVQRQPGAEGERFGISLPEDLLPDLCIDGNHCIPPEAWKLCTTLPIPGQRAVVGGDGAVPAISAASVLAKTVRDAWMERLDNHFEGYGFAVHKGYGTAEHLAALSKRGPCALHRMTFRKVRPEETQHSLFDGISALC